MIAAPGREGADWLAEQAGHLGLALVNNAVDIGVRVECPAPIMEPLTDPLYEAKLIYHTRSFGDQVRTFCMNPYGEVSTESYGDVITVNGHSYAEEKTAYTNFAVLVSTRFTEPFRDPLAYGRSIAKLANLLGDGILVQRFTDLKAGRRSTPERIAQSIIEPTLACATPGDLSAVLPYRHMTDLIEFIETMDRLVPGLAGPNTLMYGVEVKFYSSRISVGRTLETQVPGLYAVGDGAGITRGLAQSSASGVDRGEGDSGRDWRRSVALGCELPQVLPLHRRFPGTAALGSLTIAQLPTPVERIEASGGGDAATIADGIGELWVKRDDITAPEYGGNKVRKLEFLLARALQQGARSIITFGALGSNHVLATSVHGRALGLDVHAVLTPQARTAYLASNLASDLAVGAVLHPAPSFEAAPRVAVGIRAQLRDRDGVDPFVIPFGGTCPESDAAYVNAACELAEQVSRGAAPRARPRLRAARLGGNLGRPCRGLRGRRPEDPGRCGTRGPGAGRQRDLPARDRRRRRRRTARARRDLPRAHARGPRPRGPPRVLRRGLCGADRRVPRGSGSGSPRRRAHLETTYTGKALAALRADAAAGRLAGKTVVFWNTYNSRPLPARRDGAGQSRVPRPDLRACRSTSLLSASTAARPARAPRPRSPRRSRARCRLRSGATRRSRRR